MAVKSHPLLELFRLPNLPTAAGDAIAGYFFVSAASTVPETIFGVGGTAFFLYLFGLADNDITGAVCDKTAAPERPIPSGRLSLTGAKIAAVFTLIFAFCLHLLYGNGSLRVSIAALAVFVAICLYNRLKDINRFFGLVAMGCCRGLSFIFGAVSAATEDLTARLPSVTVAAIGFIAYITAVTYLASDEHRAGEPLPRSRYLGALTPLIPLPALIMCHANVVSGCIVAAGCVLTAFVWIMSVIPLGAVHTPAIRRKAVGNTIAGLMFMQFGFIISSTSFVAFVYVAVASLSYLIIKQIWPSISGS